MTQGVGRKSGAESGDIEKKSQAMDFNNCPY